MRVAGMDPPETLTYVSGLSATAKGRIIADPDAQRLALTRPEKNLRKKCHGQRGLVLLPERAAQPGRPHPRSTS